MILADVNFATIAAAVKAGRRAYDNFRKTILCIMLTNLMQELLISLNGIIQIFIVVEIEKRLTRAWRVKTPSLR